MGCVCGLWSRCDGLGWSCAELGSKLVDFGGALFCGGAEDAARVDAEVEDCHPEQDERGWAGEEE